MGSKFGCVSTPTNSVDHEFRNIQKQDGNHILPVRTLRLPNHMIDGTKSKSSVPYDAETTTSSSTFKSKSSASSKSKSAESKSKKHRLLKKRTSIRHVAFDPDHILPDIEGHTSNKSANSSSSQLFTFDNDFVMDVLEYNIPNLPIRFTKQCEIWKTEYDLFANCLSKMIFNEDKPRIIKLILEFATVDMIFCNSHHLKSNRGLWPQHYILSQTKTNLNDDGTIVSNVRDELIHSFNLQNIFEIAGNCFMNLSPTKSGKIQSMDKFFCFGIYCEMDAYFNGKGYGSSTNLNIPSYNEPHDGYYTSTASSITGTNVNPLKFKIYSHDIMVCNKGFYIERHNEFYEEHDEENEYDDQEPDYFFTLMLLPPNIASYAGLLYMIIHCTLYRYFTYCTLQSLLIIQYLMIM